LIGESRRVRRHYEGVSMSCVLECDLSYLMCDIWSGITDVAVHLAHDADVFVAVEEGVFLIALAWSAAAMGGLVRLETGIGEDDDEAFAVLVGGGDGDVLLSNELGELGRGQRLGS
jgi:hypothetical protein